MRGIEEIESYNEKPDKSSTVNLKDIMDKLLEIYDKLSENNREPEPEPEPEPETEPEPKEEDE